MLTSTKLARATSVPTMLRETQKQSEAHPGKAQAGLQGPAQLLNLWHPGNLYLSSATQAAPTLAREDGFSFRAVSLLTPLILGVLMMNFFLFLFYLFSLYCLLPLPCNSVEGTEQMALSVEGRGLLRIQSQPTLQSHDHTCKESLDFPWETQMQ